MTDTGGESLYVKSTRDIPEELDLPPFEEVFNLLAEITEQQAAIYRAAVETTEWNPVDHLVLAAIVRSNAITKGFLDMVRVGNKLCAVPMIRMQLDSALRLQACTMSNDPQFMSRVIRGERISNFTDASGKKMTDKYLHECLDKLHPGITTIYEYTSGYVHLSQAHLVDSLNLRQSTETEFRYSPPDSLPEWEDSVKSWQMLAFARVSSVISDICEGWFHAKLDREAPEE